MPARKVRPRGSAFTQRLAGYIDEQFEGNITLAAKAMQIDYDQLNRLATGRTTRPSLEVLQQLIYYSDRSPAWWISGKEEVTT